MSHEGEIRAFVAIPLPLEVIDFLTQLISNLKQIFPENSLKWVEPGNIHLTLKFLGNISKSTKNFLLNKLEPDHRLSPFELTINKVGAFPSIYKPQVIWVGTSNHKMLMNLKQFVSESTSIVKNEEDKKPFSPHLTIARLRPGTNKASIEAIKQELYKNQKVEPISFTIKDFCLFQSTLTSKGPFYSEIRRYCIPISKTDLL